ncbi:hypothetical protein FRC03_006458, partial [Tulasnella sp. 419]
MEPLERCGREGKKMACADRNIRNVFTIVAAHMADAPEQCLIACCQENHCPQCLVPPDQHGSLLSFDSRQPDAILSLLQRSDNPDTETKAQLKAYGLRPVFPPFWAQLPHANIFSSLTPDLLHQIHKGVFKDHLVKWCTSLMACGELDYRYMSMPRHPALRQFKTGIAKVKQWTGKEFKMMERVFIGAIAGGTNRQRVLEAARALLDFIYLSQFPVHTSDTLDKMRSALNDFHRFKDVFIHEEVRSHFNIPKFHSLVHYVDAIASHGPPDGFNTESPERLHIEVAKKGYRASNKKGYVKQMVRYVLRQEAIAHKDMYLHWYNPELARDLCDDTKKDNEEDEEADDLWKVEDEEYRSFDAVPFKKDRVTIRYAKQPPLKDLTLPILLQHFHASNFLPCLIQFLENSVQYQRKPFPMPSKHESFDVYKQIILDVTPHSALIPGFVDRVYSTPAKVPHILPKLGTQSFFSTVLVRDNTPGATFNVRVGQVRVIFQLPSTIILKYDVPLVYIEWFTELKQTRSKARMLEVQKAFCRDGLRDCSIVRVDQIVRSCHLIPKWEDDLSSVLEPDEVYD